MNLLFPLSLSLSLIGGYCDKLSVDLRVQNEHLPENFVPLP